MKNILKQIKNKKVIYFGILLMLLIAATYLLANGKQRNINTIISDNETVNVQQGENTPQDMTLQELHDKSYELIQLEDYSGALAAAESAIKIDPNYVDAYIDKGMALYSMDKCLDGAASLYHAVNLDPENETLGAILGSMLSECEK